MDVVDGNVEEELYLADDEEVSKSPPLELEFCVPPLPLAKALAFALQVHKHCSYRL